jgi:hypothetical protein
VKFLSPLHTLRSVLAGLALIVAAGSCSKSPTQPDPTPQPIQVTGISPAVGATQGGTPVTITGSGFVSGVSVTIGGVAAANVSVSSSTTLTAVAGPRTAGTGDVVVSHDGRQGVLANAFTYVVPSAGPNDAPAIDDVRAQGGRPGQPAFMADLGETLDVSATVTDAETAPDALTYEWAATSGTFSGSGAAVTWRAPDTLPATPVTVTVTLTVIERYLEFDERNVPMAREHRVSVSHDVRVHHSIEEVRTKARNFLLAFSDSSIPTPEVMRDFSPNCSGTADETFDVDRNRCTYIINDFFVGDATPTINFGGRCEFRNRAADACVMIPVRWDSTVRDDANSCPLNDTTLIPGNREIAEGLDQVTAVYEAGEWRLCGSDFLLTSGQPTRFKRE